MRDKWVPNIAYFCVTVILPMWCNQNPRNRMPPFLILFRKFTT